MSMLDSNPTPPTSPTPPADTASPPTSPTPPADTSSPPTAPTPPADAPAPQAQTPTLPQSTAPNFIDASTWKINLPQGHKVDEQAHQAFLDQCAKKGMTQEQTQFLFDYHLKEQADILQKSINEGTQALKQNWGMNFDKNLDLSMRTMALIDKSMEGRLLPMIERAGLSNHPEVIEMFKEIGSKMSEDSLGATYAAQSFDKPMTAHERFKGMFQG